MRHSINFETVLKSKRYSAFYFKVNKLKEHTERPNKWDVNPQDGRLSMPHTMVEVGQRDISWYIKLFCDLVVDDRLVALLDLCLL